MLLLRHDAVLLLGHAALLLLRHGAVGGNSFKDVSWKVSRSGTLATYAVSDSCCCIGGSGLSDFQGEVMRRRGVNLGGGGSTIFVSKGNELKAIKLCNSSSSRPAYIRRSGSRLEPHM